MPMHARMRELSKCANTNCCDSAGDIVDLPDQRREREQRNPVCRILQCLPGVLRIAERLNATGIHANRQAREIVCAPSARTETDHEFNLSTDRIDTECVCDSSQV